MPEANVTLRSVLPAISANHVPVQPTATITPCPAGDSMLKNGKATCDERPPCGAMYSESPGASTLVRWWKSCFETWLPSA